ncbi:YbjN domain-containing protein [Paractinoplanes durhamensis]|uniref:YbjN domain-containing protein n=1 Tax=Paractinoplanes durhamensis TaxID=113563 RepID=UPI001EF35F7C|nr:YbjN domain-containing protein [Actinoplanes durhamensis]
MQALTQEMIKSVLDARSFSYMIDADDDVVGNFQGNLVYFFQIGDHREMLQVRAMVQHIFGMEDVTRLYEFCNAWNHDRLWPKAYVHIQDDGTVNVIGEVLADWEKGVTVEQLDQVMLCGIATGCQLADAVAELRQDRPTN